MSIPESKFNLFREFRFLPSIVWLMREIFLRSRSHHALKIISQLVSKVSQLFSFVLPIFLAVAVTSSFKLSVGTPRPRPPPPCLPLKTRDQCGQFRRANYTFVDATVAQMGHRKFQLNISSQNVYCFIAFTSESLDYIFTFFLEMSTCYTYMFCFFVISQCRIFLDLFRTKEIISKMFYLKSSTIKFQYFDYILDYSVSKFQLHHFAHCA